MDAESIRALLSGNSRTLSSFGKTDLPAPKQHLSRRGQRKKLRKERARQQAEIEDAPRRFQQDKADSDEEAQSLKLPIKVDARLRAAPDRPEQDEPQQSLKDMMLSKRVKRRKTASDAHAADTNHHDTKVEAVEVMDGDDSDDEQQKQPEPTLGELRLKIAELATAVVENPEGSMGKLKELVVLVEAPPVKHRKTVAKLAMASAASVFKDVLPDYRIRGKSDQEAGVKLSKDVARLHDFEQGLLASYQRYLQALYERVKAMQQIQRKGDKNRSNSDSQSQRDTAMALGTAAVRCLCLMLREAYHFNFRNNIIDVLIPVFCRTKDTEIRLACASAVRAVFSSDNTYDASLQVVKTLCREARSLHFGVDSEVLGVLESLKIQDKHVKAKQHEAVSARQQQAQERFRRKDGHATRRRRKELKAEKQLASELQETAAKVNEKVLSHNQTQILTQLFSTYVRLIKHAKKSPALAAALSGLARFGQLVDIAYVSDTIAVLEELVSDETLDMEAALAAIRAGTVMLSGHGAALSIDPRRFHSALFQRLPLLVEKPHLVPSALDALHHMLILRTEIVQERVAGFYKRLASIGLHVEHHLALGILAFCRKLMLTYPFLQPMVENDLITTGEFLPYATEPERCHALSSVSWEVTVFQRHYNPYVRTHARHIAHGCPATGPETLDLRHATTAPADFCRLCAPVTATGSLVFAPGLAAPNSRS